MSPIHRKGRFVSKDVDSRRTISSDNFGEVGRKNNVRERGACMIAAKGATYGNLSTSLSASSSNTDQKADELIFSDAHAQDDGDDGGVPVCVLYN